jgi:hypothetical protein
MTKTQEVRFLIKTSISAQEYQEKRYEVAKAIISSVMTAADLQSGESKQRTSIIFNSLQVADSLLEELYTKSFARGGGDEPSVHNLSDILKNAKDE